MAISNFLGTCADNQYVESERREELIEIETHPVGEREEVRQIYAKKGFEGDTLEHIVALITSDKKQWVDTMLLEEHGLTISPTYPAMAALITFSSFAFVGILPLIPFLLNWWWPNSVAQSFLWSTLITLIAFFVVGAFK